MARSACPFYGEVRISQRKSEPPRVFGKSLPGVMPAMGAADRTLPSGFADCLCLLADTVRWEVIRVLVTTGADAAVQP
jgi:hypothetical protein